MFKNPRITDRTAPDHEAGGLGAFKVGEPGLTIDDVAICDDGAGHLLDGTADPIIMNGSLVTFFDSAAVDCEEVDGVFFEDVKEGFKFVFGFETDSRFHGERKFSAGFAEASEEGVDLIGFSE